MLDAFERSTSRQIVVSAFGQAGIVSLTPDLTGLYLRVTYKDPPFAWAVPLKTGLFEGSARTDIAQRKLLKTANKRKRDPR